MGRFTRIANGADFQDDREPELRIGDLVILNSGGPTMLVVEVEGERVTTAWKDTVTPGGISECTWPRICLHRNREAW